MLQSRRRVGQNGIDPFPDGVNHLPRLLAKIDGQHAEITLLCGNGPNQPGTSLAIFDNATTAWSLVAFGQSLARALDLLRHPSLIGNSNARHAARGAFEQDRPMTNDRGQMFPNSGVDVTWCVGRG